MAQFKDNAEDFTDLPLEASYTDEQIKSKYENNPDTNAFTDSEKAIVSTAISNVVEDLTPKLGGTLNAQDEKIDNVKVVVFNGVGLYDNGTKTTNFSINPLNAQYQKVTINGDCTLAIVAPDGPCTIYLHIYQGTTGGKLTLPAGYWVGGDIKNNTLTPNTGYDLLMINYTGSNFIFGMMYNLVLT